MAKIAPVNIPTFIFGAKIQIQNSILATIRMSWVFFSYFQTLWELQTIEPSSSSSKRPAVSSLINGSAWILLLAKIPASSKSINLNIFVPSRLLCEYYYGYI